MTDRIKIETATLAHLAEIRLCAQSAYAMYVERMGREPAPMVADFTTAVLNQHVHVALLFEPPSPVAGFVIFFERGDHVHLENLAVSPAHQGKGFGKQIIAFVEETARSRTGQAVELYTNEAMLENIALYTRLGYQEVDRRAEDGFNRVYFRKNIGSARST